jgi:hypothetical protein
MSAALRHGASMRRISCSADISADVDHGVSVRLHILELIDDRLEVTDHI